MTLRKLILTTAVVLALFPAQAAYAQQPEEGAAAATPPPDKPNLRLIFTGYLLGYYRVPNIQAQDFLGSCWEGATPDNPWANASPAVQDFSNKKKDIPFNRDDETLTIGMGDNFGIDLGSRIYGEKGRRHPKQSKPGAVPAAMAPGGVARNPDDPWPPMTAPDQIGDNVGCFMSLAGYDVIVPGKLDFYFGPERLRRIAQRLASVPEPNGQDHPEKGETFHPVQTLAVNLIQHTTYWKEPRKIPDSEKRLDFVPGLPEGVQAVEITDHGTVLPFLQTVTFRVSKDLNIAPYLCKLSMEDDPDYELPCPAAEQKALAPTWCDNDMKLKACPDKEDKVRLTYPLGGLEAEVNYGLCVAPRSDFGETEPHCVRFTVARPYLLSAFTKTCTDTSESCKEWEKPYFYRRWPDGRQVVIFGVVDPDLPSLVGRDNLSWKNTDPRLQTTVATLDPVKALQQAEQLFEEQEKGNIDKSKLRRVLLAHMNRAKAEELASHLDFDVVIAQAADRGHATGSIGLTLYPEPAADGSPGQSFRSVVVVPERSLDSSRKLTNPIRELAMHDFDASSPGGARRELVVKTNWDPISKGDPQQHLQSSLQKKLDDTAKEWLGPGGAKDEPFVIATLKIMRDATNADLAMMQKRDFYFGDFRLQAHMGENIAGVLWKGDVLQVITATGATLKKVFGESKQFDQADIQPTKFREESGRGLLLYGVQTTEDGNYLVDGQLLDKDRLYTVATTSHISAGDTGYPELNDPQLANRFLPQSSQEEVNLNRYEGAEDGPAQGKQISELACEEMRHLLEEDNAMQPGCITDEGNGLFASSNQQAPQSRADLWTRMVAWSRTSMDRPLLPKEKYPTGLTAEQAVQNRPTWLLSLQELSWNFSSVRNNLTEVQRVTQLTGASDPAAYAAKGHGIDYATRADWERNTTSVDEFIRGQLLYKANSTGATKTVGPASTVVQALPNLSQPKDQALLDTGFFWHGLGRNKYYPQQGIVFEPFHFDTPLIEEQLSINSHYNSSTGVLDRPAFQVPLQRTRMYLGRLGYRFQNKGNSFEVGYEGGWETNALEKLTFMAGGKPAECDLTAKQTLTTCLTGQPITLQPGTIHQVRDTRTRDGYYVDLDWTLPLFWRLSFVALDQGEYFREDHLDNSSDTLYRNLASGTVRIPIWPNLSIAPGLERIDYENKLNHTHLATWSPVLKLVYNLDHYSGGDWGKAMRFKPPTGQ